MKCFQSPAVINDVTQNHCCAAAVAGIIARDSVEQLS